MTEVVRVLIADDHARRAASVRQALEDDGGFVVCAEAEDGPSAFDQARSQTRPDVCLLDINMPERDLGDDSNRWPPSPAPRS